MSENKHRRHLTTMQLAVIVALAQDWTEAAHHGGMGANRYTKNLQSVREEHSVKTTADRAAQSGASPSTQRRADTLAKASRNFQ